MKERGNNRGLISRVCVLIVSYLCQIMSFLVLTSDLTHFFCLPPRGGRRDVTILTLLGCFSADGNLYETASTLDLT